VKTVIVVQARMGSTRLPGKVLKQVLGKPLLEYLAERLRRVRLADAFAIATTTNSEDAAIVAECERLGVPYTRGPDLDVLARYHEAALAHHADVVVRVTSDCPLIDPAVVDAAIGMYRAGGHDYISNALRPGFPLGMAVEVFSAALLEQAAREALAPAEREHVTPFFYLRPERFRVGHLANRRDLSAERWTVDTEQDFALVSRMIEAIADTKPAAGMDDLVELLDRHPGWRAINASVQQKTFSQ
jgi:spore coat polysaccharide biosynthesis protein SpsF